MNGLGGCDCCWTGGGYITCCCWTEGGTSISGEDKEGREGVGRDIVGTLTLVWKSGYSPLIIIGTIHFAEPEKIPIWHFQLSKKVNYDILK